MRGRPSVPLPGLDQEGDKRMRSGTYYEVLGVDEDASADEIRRERRRLVEVWHPDRFSGRLRVEAAEMMTAINLATSCLRSRVILIEPNAEKCLTLAQSGTFSAQLLTIPALAEPRSPSRTPGC